MSAQSEILMTPDDRASVAAQINQLTGMLRALEQKLHDDDILQRKEAERKAEEAREKRYYEKIVPLEKAVAETRKPPFTNRDDADAYARAEYALASATGGWTRSITDECGGHRSYTEFKDTLFARIFRNGNVAIPVKYCKFETPLASIRYISEKAYVVL